MLGVIWWMYGGYAWLTNAVAPDRRAGACLLLGGMAAYLVLALAIPDAFSRHRARRSASPTWRSWCVHAGLFTRDLLAGDAAGALRASRRSTCSPRWSCSAAAIAGGTAQYVLWALAFGLEWITPRLIDARPAS